MLLFLSFVALGLVCAGALIGAWACLYTFDAVDQAERPVLHWAARALRTDVPLEVLADALPYSGAGDLEAEALIDRLSDAGWSIVPAFTTTTEGALR